MRAKFEIRRRKSLAAAVTDIQNAGDVTQTTTARWMFWPRIQWTCLYSHGFRADLSEISPLSGNHIYTWIGPIDVNSPQETIDVTEPYAIAPNWTWPVFLVFIPSTRKDFFCAKCRHITWPSVQLPAVSRLGGKWYRTTSKQDISTFRNLTFWLKWILAHLLTYSTLRNVYNSTPVWFVFVSF